jgi:hypothetical protein
LNNTIVYVCKVLDSSNQEVITNKYTGLDTAGNLALAICLTILVGAVTIALIGNFMVCLVRRSVDRRAAAFDKK